ncbi:MULTISPECIES: terminase small subunit [Pseudomonas]|uniref:terminase small subunit n=1 Tax=Pseudomonas TaxID=286 RepID=UPI002598648E|nr:MULTISPECIES: terminase small subunit [Pseudomonas]
MALNQKKRAFIDAVRAGASNKEAAIAAGCPEKTAAQAGSRLAKDPDVLRELNKSASASTVNSDVNDSVNTRSHVARRYTDPLEFLMDQMNDLNLEEKDRRDAAKALMPFIHQRKGESGKKDAAKDAAAQAAAGRFGVRQPPKNVVPIGRR